ncbi:MAG TPA: hypothetical protein VN519_04725 [Bryobacteraceae bacterium]|nr:hypothetical protein [Bryobacteraceae bacterium]
MAASAIDQPRAEREREVEDALASVRMEELEPPEEALAIFQRYVEGGVTLEEMGAPAEDVLRPALIFRT